MNSPHVAAVMAALVCCLVVAVAATEARQRWSGIEATVSGVGSVRTTGGPAAKVRSSTRRGSEPMCGRDEDSLCFDETCGLDLALLATADHEDFVCDCVEQDVGYTYTRCDTATNTRSLLYFWKPPATCLNGGSLPAPVHGIPCDIVCYEGQYLDVAANSSWPPVCRTCPAGTYSPGTGHRWTTWSEWPAQFSTYCSTGGSAQRPCQAWQLRGGYVDSGDNFDEHYLVSVLSIRLRIFAEVGSVRFDYTVNGDAGDRFYFIVDDLVYIAEQGGGPRDDWRSSPTIELAPGYHQIKWSYLKDRSKSLYEDRVKLRAIEVQGSQLDPIRCSLCSPDTYAPLPGASQCLPCPSGTTAGWGAAACHVCQPWQHNYEYYGCLTLPNCTAADYAEYVTECRNGARDRYSAWLQPSACLASDELPHNVTGEPCSLVCQPGQIATPTGCQDCPDGYYHRQETTGEEQSGSVADECAACASGSATTPKQLVVTSFAVLPAWMTTGCAGDCLDSNSGWRAGGSFLDSGYGNGANSNSYLRLQLNMSYSGSLAVQFQLTCAAPSELLFYVGPVEALTYTCDSSAALRTAVVADIPAGARNVYIVYRKLTAPLLPASDDRVLVTSIAVTGSTLGSSDGCALCPVSSVAAQSAQAACTPCPAGYHTLGRGAVECTPCAENYFSRAGGLCYHCGANTHSAAGSASCQYDPSALLVTTDQLGSPVPPRTFKFQPLASVGVVGPIVDAANPHNSFYINLQSDDMRGTGCLEPQPDFVADSPSGDYLRTHSCLVTTQQVATFTSSNATNLGSVIGFSYSSASTADGLHVYNLIVSFSSPDSLARSSLTIMCDPEALAIEPVSLTSADYPAALFHFSWLSKYGCPLCTADDVDSVLSACNDGYKTRRFYWKTRCVPGIELPSTQREPCEGVQLDASVGVTIALVVLLVLGACLSVLAYVYHRWRSTQAQYEVLLGERAPPEPDQPVVDQAAPPPAARLDVEEAIHS